MATAADVPVAASRQASHPAGSGRVRERAPPRNHAAPPSKSYPARGKKFRQAAPRTAGEHEPQLLVFHGVGDDCRFPCANGTLFAILWTYPRDPGVILAEGAALRTPWRRSHGARPIGTPRNKEEGVTMSTGSQRVSHWVRHHGRHGLRCGAAGTVDAGASLTAARPTRP